MKGQFKNSEFTDVIFKKIYNKQSKKGYYQLRQLNKAHQSGFEDGIDSASVDCDNLQEFAQSKFSDQVQFLNVKIHSETNDWNLLRFISTTYLTKIQKVKVIVIRGKECPPYHEIQQQQQQQQIDVSEPLIFHGVNFVGNQHLRLWINSSNDIQILNSNFDAVTLCLKNLNKITIKNSTFNCRFDRYYTLHITDARNQVTIENVQVFNALDHFGIFIGRCENAIMNHVLMENCGSGCQFLSVNYVKLVNIKVHDCLDGFLFHKCQNAIMEDCVVNNFYDKGLGIWRSNVSYKGVYLNDNLIMDNNLQELITIYEISLRESTFARIL
eukprot:TRINITY_DN1358_c0_g1_i6.p1 TRINITY_DN1358_c0_g1~~TRINITY_DN1358_c0_g1_i6.p1  ORF type:complete len:346 (-),score=10.76 TRINITY_DN1358_c0_g1_i6:273-1250(-)